jgi:flagellar protein FliO/FliZ
MGSAVMREDLMTQPTGPSMWPALLVFLVVAVAVPLCLAVLRRMLDGSVSRKPGGPELKMLNSIAIGQRERVAIIEANGRMVLVGITAHSITMLSDLGPAPVALNGSKSEGHTQDAVNPTFAQALKANIEKVLG